MGVRVRFRFSTGARVHVRVGVGLGLGLGLELGFNCFYYGTHHLKVKASKLSWIKLSLQN